VVKLVEAKHAAEGTPAEEEYNKRCSAGIVEEYCKYVSREREALQEMRPGAKGWWAKCRRLLQQKSTISSIPALRDSYDKWVLDAKSKANLFVSAFSKKCKLTATEVNDYSNPESSNYSPQRELPTVQVKHAETVLKELREDSGTGPDLLPTRILRQCAAELALPVQMLTLTIIAAGIWPQSWLVHWVVPLFKKKSVYEPNNYRGVHLTVQLSKAVERLLKALFVPYLDRVSAFGPNQFAYTVGRGARDVLATLILNWISILVKGMKIAVYCSDVTGAFDRVSMERLIMKMKAKKLHPQIIDVISSWLRQRAARVVVGGEYSDVMVLANMVFQGTVLGPTLWNRFFEDARLAINEWHYTEVVYADDLNAYRAFASTTSNEVIDESITKCQQELHRWGRANQVAFDAAKESRHIMSLTQPAGDSFKLLGVIFDGGLAMTDAVGEVVASASWKLRTLIRTRRYYSDAELVLLYKAQVLSYMEYRTSAVYHGTREVLARLDAVQTKFLLDAGIDEITSLMVFNLAPLRMRRDIAMLGMLHRAALGEGPPQLKQLFRRRRGRLMLEDPYGAETVHPLVKRSAWGLVPVYNKLGSGAHSIKSVKLFQQYLQERVKVLIQRDFVGNDWACSYSPR
jgi:hypothetical protein